MFSPRDNVAIGASGGKGIINSSYSTLIINRFNCFNACIESIK